MKYILTFIMGLTAICAAEKPNIITGLSHDGSKFCTPDGHLLDFTQKQITRER